MTRENHQRRSPSCLAWIVVVILVPIVGVILSALLYRPDRRIADIDVSGSTGPTFAVQIIRPREGLPLGGLVPPNWFGVDARLGFDSGSKEASYRLSADEIEFSAEDWRVRIVLDSQGRIDSRTEVIFPLIFENHSRRVRCRPGEPVVGDWTVTKLGAVNELSGHFEIELSRSEDVETGDRLGWPPKPLVLHGSFARLPLEQRAQEVVRKRLSEDSGNPSPILSGAEGSRTLDLCIANAALSQLSYGPIRSSAARRDGRVNLTHSKTHLDFCPAVSWQGEGEPTVGAATPIINASSKCFKHQPFDLVSDSIPHSNQSSNKLFSYASRCCDSPYFCVMASHLLTASSNASSGSKSCSNAA